MNISTYEARIAALEAQLGPGPGPGPGPSDNGIAGVSFYPNFIPQGKTDDINLIVTGILPLQIGERAVTFNYEIANFPETIRVNAAAAGTAYVGIIGSGMTDEVWSESGTNAEAVLTPEIEQGVKKVNVNITASNEPSGEGEYVTMSFNLVEAKQ